MINSAAEFTTEMEDCGLRIYESTDSSKFTWESIRINLRVKSG
jgi:hypothetical protein